MVRVQLLTRFARLAARAPRAVLLAALAVLVVAGGYGIPASLELPAAGYDVPDSESARADQVLESAFGAGGYTMVFTVRADAGVDSPAARARAETVAAALRESPHIRNVLSYWTAPAPLNTALRGTDGAAGLVVARIAGDDEEATVRARALADPLVGARDGVEVAAGGQAMTYSEGGDQSKRDLFLMEAIAFPLTFLALVWIFGSVTAASLPMAVSAVAVAGSAAALSLIDKMTDVSVFAVNLATALCLALAIDYTLFIVNRYREELANGTPPEAALVRTMNTAGRTVTYSALTVALTISAMVIFPQYLVRSLAFAGLVSVVFSLLGSLLIAPALLVVLGPRIDALDIRRPIARLFGRTVRDQHVSTENHWYRTAMFSMRHAVPVVGVIGALLLVLALPALGMKLGYPDDRVLPATASARAAGDTLRSDFTRNFAGTVYIVLPEGVTNPQALSGYAENLSRVPDVVAVSAPGGSYAGGSLVSPATYDSAMRADAAYLTVATTLDPYSDAGKRQLDALRAVGSPAPTLFGGVAQRNIDNVAGITDRTLYVLAGIAVMTFVLIFLMTGSLVLPIKALLMNVLSLGAAFGALVWLFQDGHLGALGTTATGQFTAFIPPLLACVAYALAMDYEVFVLSRVREEWLKSGRTAADNERAVALGLARTGRIVTAAAAVMIVVFIAMSAGQVSFMRGLGVGLAVGVALDAFLVRPLLVPAAMRLMGRFNWWAPAPLARWHDRWGLTELETVSESRRAPAPAPVAAVAE
ncbi:MMPL family transporter [Nocardia goodfellowii]|uniref:RND superfamily putative drug exporter n=1 Tax=Nocardia goodfellowii TaxID=882446 RepID=A0ABS4QJD9_9NOCA|nr:MMPL family transporter [Nocardia goodfellowii]MBP2191824.1 RND superfamily putative drug exporter [Nocardia goodfellowii]